MIQKIDISALMFASRSVLVVVGIKYLKGERDDGQQTLVTCTCLRWHVRRGVVNIVVVNDKVLDVKSMFLFACLLKPGKMFTRAQEAYLCIPNQLHILYFIVG